MNATPQVLSWYIFGGTAFLFLGASLFFDAEEKAKATGEWRSLQDSPEAGPAGSPDARLVWVHRFLGIIFILIGAVFLFGVIFHRPGLLARVSPAELGKGQALAVGLLLMCAGSGLGFMKIRRGGLPGLGAIPLVATFLPSPEKGTFKYRLARAAGWGFIAALICQGMFLVRLAGQ